MQRNPFHGGRGPAPRQGQQGGQSRHHGEEGPIDFEAVNTTTVDGAQVEHMAEAATLVIMVGIIPLDLGMDGLLEAVQVVVDSLSLHLAMEGLQEDDKAVVGIINPDIASRGRKEVDKVVVDYLSLDLAMEGLQEHDQVVVCLLTVEIAQMAGRHGHKQLVVDLLLLRLVMEDREVDIAQAMATLNSTTARAMKKSGKKIPNSTTRASTSPLTMADVADMADMGTQDRMDEILEDPTILMGVLVTSLMIPGSGSIN
ncbi:hypothetical protein G7Y79_00002g008250 [Physcia stellaris]|nr:hypothetical protein G7Y79_00002g008250 [Physcia stellaris]